MGIAHICDKCKQPIKYASDVKITIYKHPYGDMEYELCANCQKKLEAWLQEKQ